MHTRTITIATALLLVAGAGLTGCSAVKDVIDVAAPIVDAVGDESTWIEVGDCFNEAAGDVVSDIPTVPCTDAHDYEVFADFEIDLANYPGDDEVSRLADEGCYAPFGTYVGTAFENSSLDFSFYTPTKDGWNNYDDRLVSCILFDPAGELVGSVAGSAR